MTAETVTITLPIETIRCDLPTLFDIDVAS